MKIGVKPEREFSRPVERKIWLLGGEQGSVSQPKAEIPRNSEKGCATQAAPFFLCQNKNNSEGYLARDVTIAY
jgi:hypothetical protein